MKDAREIFLGIVTVLVSFAMLFGAFSISLAEGNTSLPLTPTLLPTITLTWQPSITPGDSHTPPPFIWTPTWTSTVPPTPSSCPPPPGWQPYIVKSGDTLEGLALQRGESVAQIDQANCLGSANLLPGMLVYLPSLPTRTQIPCGPPHTWVVYYVQQGDTLYHLGQAFGIPYLQIQRANCLPNSYIRIGQRLYVPPWATRTPSPTLPLQPTSMWPSETPWFIWTDTPINTPTDTPTESTVDPDYPLP